MASDNGQDYVTKAVARPIQRLTEPTMSLKAWRHSDETKSRFLDYLFLLAAASVWAVPVFLSYRLIRDDLSNVGNFHQFLNTLSLSEGLARIATNEWIGHFARSFFLSWWIQLFLLLLSGNTSIFGVVHLFATFIIAVHILNTLMIYRIAMRFLADRLLCMTLALAYLFLPYAVECYLVANNWFFVLPLFFYLAFVNVLTSFRPLSLWTMAAAAILLVASMFSGEQLLAVPYAVALTYLGIEYVKKCPLGKAYLLQAAVVYTIGLSAFAVYFMVIARNQNAVEGAAALHFWSLLSGHTLAVVLDYTRALLREIVALLNVNSALYGAGSIPWSSLSLVLAAAVGVAFCAYALFTKAGRMSAPPRAIVLAVVVLGVALAATMLPMYLAALTGVRPGVETRYLMNPGLLIASLAVVLASALLARRLMRIAVFSLLSGYLAFLTLHQILDVWSTQAAIDDRLWEATNRAVTPEINFVLTLNNDTDHASLMPPYLSVAWSDFQADWGIQSVLRDRLKREVTMVRTAVATGNGGLEVTGYYGTKYSTTEQHLAVIYFDNAPTLGKSARRTVEVMSFSDYSRRASTLRIPKKIYAP